MEFSPEGIRRYAKNTGWLLTGRVLQVLLGLAVTIVVARYLGPGQFGLLNYVLAATYLLGVVANVGMDGIARRELVERADSRNHILGTYFILGSAIALVIYVAMALGVWAMVQGEERRLLFFILGGVFVAATFRIIDLWFHARVESGAVVFATVLSVIGSALVKLWLVYVGAGLLWFASAILLESVLLGFLRLVFYKKQKGSVSAWRFDSGIALSFIRNGGLLMLSAVATNVYMKLDQVMIGLLIDDAAVGIYAAAVRLSTTWHVIPVVLATSLFPAILKAKSESEEKYLHRLGQYFSLNTSLAYGIMIPMVLTAPFLIEWIYGADYSPAAPILTLHIVTVILAFLQIARSQYLLAEGFYRFILVSSVVGAAVNIGLNLILIPTHGGIGAAISTIVAQVCGIILINFVTPGTRRMGLLIIRSIFKPWKVFWRS